MQLKLITTQQHKNYTGIFFFNKMYSFAKTKYFFIILTIHLRLCFRCWNDVWQHKFSFDFLRNFLFDSVGSIIFQSIIFFSNNNFQSLKLSTYKKKNLTYKSNILQKLQLTKINLFCNRCATGNYMFYPLMTKPHFFPFVH